MFLKHLAKMDLILILSKFSGQIGSKPKRFPFNNLTGLAVLMETLDGHRNPFDIHVENFAPPPPPIFREVSATASRRRAFAQNRCIFQVIESLVEADIRMCSHPSLFPVVVTS
jgi:hypothetical protein